MVNVSDKTSTSDNENIQSLVGDATKTAGNEIIYSDLSANIKDINAVVNTTHKSVAEKHTFNSIADENFQINRHLKNNEDGLSVSNDKIQNIQFKDIENVELQKDSLSDIIDDLPFNMVQDSEKSIISPITPDMQDNSQQSLSTQVSNLSIESIHELSDAVLTSASNTLHEWSEAGANTSEETILPLTSIPSPKKDLQIFTPSSAIEQSTDSIKMQNPPFIMQEMQNQLPLECNTIQLQIKSNDDTRINSTSVDLNERLRGNILMYLPHGARIKKSIIKGLISKKFSTEEIETQINLMIAENSLQVEVENGIEYLLRS
ncbi:MAG: hypothetical protein H5T43_05710 [Methanomethylovorans sp.]|nr:hypothetical protein [Methanomethylovorans sp.]